MNDSKNSSNGLLVISSRIAMKSDQLGKLRETIETLAESMGLESMVLDGDADAHVSIDYTPLLTRLCVAVERLVAQGEPPSVSEEIAPQALNARPTGLNSRPSTTDTLKADMERSFHEREHRALGQFISDLGKPSDG